MCGSYIIIHEYSNYGNDNLTCIYIWSTMRLSADYAGRLKLSTRHAKCKMYINNVRQTQCFNQFIKQIQTQFLQRHGRLHRHREHHGVAAQHTHTHSHIIDIVTVELLNIHIHTHTHQTHHIHIHTPVSSHSLKLLWCLNRVH